MTSQTSQTSQFPTLPTGPLPHLAMDYGALRAEGLRLLGRLGGQQWTDYNTHDPGITILEQLCYAITELAYRTNFPVPDLLAASQELGLPGPSEILTCEPVTKGDLRKRVLDVTGIANGWIEQGTAALPFYHHAASEALGLTPDPAETSSASVPLRGLHRVLLQTSDQLSGDAALQAVAARVHAGRALGEDYELALLGSFKVWIRAIVEVGPLDDPAVMVADLIERIDDYLAPRARFVSLADALAQGRSVAELFEGPMLARGFVDHLPSPRRHIYTSDILHAALDLPQVRAVPLLEIATSSSAKPSKWSLEVPTGYVAQIDPASKLELRRAGLRVRVDDDAVRAVLERRRVAGSIAAGDTRALAPTPGRPRALGRYRSLRRQLPDAYGVGPLGLSPELPASRKAQARQLEAYLLIFDQLLANAFAQLEHAHELLSPDEGGLATYFAQRVDDAPLAFDHLLSGSADQHQQWLDQQVEPGDPIERRKRFLGHLLARFGEQLGDHNLVERTDAANTSDAALIRDRQAYLRNYARLSGGRGTGYDLRSADAGAVLEDRLRLKLGLGEHRFAIVEHVLLRPLPEDAAQRVPEGEEQIPLLAAVNSADPYSLQISYVFEELPSYAGNTSNLNDPAYRAWLDQRSTFEHLVARTLIDETPAHLRPQLHWFGSEGIDHWGLFEQAWADFRVRHAEYRLMRLSTSQVDTLVQLRARDARDRVIDLLEFGKTYPLRDIPMPANVIVAPGNPTQITLGFSQRGVIYQLRHRDTGAAILLAGQPIEAEGTGEALVLPTPPIDEDVTYRILAIKREDADDPEKRRETWLSGSVRVEEGVDPALIARIVATPLDPRIDDLKPGDARLVEYGSNVTVEVLASQEGVTYELLDHAALGGAAISAPVIGTSSTIVLTYLGAKEDIDLRVRGRKAVGDPQNPEIREAVLDLILPLRVRASTSPGALLDPAIVGHAGTTTLKLSGTQQSVSYRPWQRSIRDAEFVFDVVGQATPSDIITVNDDKRAIRTLRPPRVTDWVDIAGFTPLGNAVAGSGAALSIPLGSFERDCFVLVQAIKQHRRAPLTSGDVSTLPSAEQLTVALALHVRPNPDQALRMRVFVDAGAASGPWLVMDGQTGAYYELSSNGQPAFTSSAYFHQRDDQDSRVNKGIGQLRIGVDLAVARDRTTAGDPTTNAPALPNLDARSPIALGTELSVLARKAMSSLTAQLSRTAKLWPVPTITAAKVAAGSVGTIVIVASVAGERYTLLRDETAIAGPLNGTGADLQLQTEPLAQTSVFVVQMERSGGLVIVRRVRVTVEVTPPDQGGPQPPAEA